MAKCAYMTPSWKKCGKDAKWRLGGVDYCDEHYKMVVGAMKSASPAEALKSAEKSAQSNQPGRIKSSTQNIMQTIRYSMPISASKILGYIIAIVIGAFILNYLLDAVMIGDQTARQWLVINISPIIEPILFLTPTLLYGLIIGVPALIFLIIVRYGNIGQNFYNLLLVLFVAVWLPDLLLGGYWIASSYTLGQAQIQCIFSGGDITTCGTQQQQNVAAAEAGVFESPVKADYGMYDIVSNSMVLTNPTSGMVYSTSVRLQPNTNYGSEVSGVVVNLVGETIKKDVVQFMGRSCTSTSACTINKDIPIIVSFESMDVIPCGSSSMDLYSQIYYPMESMRSGYQVRIIRSDDDAGTSLANKISDASTIFGPVNFWLGFSPSQNVVIPENGNGKVVVQISVENKLKGVALVNDIFLVQQPERSDSGVYKLNLVSCTPLMPSVSEEKGNMKYTFDWQTEIKPSETYEYNQLFPDIFGGDGEGTREAVKSSVTTCTFEIPFSLKDTGSPYKTINFNVGGSYTYYEKTTSQPVQIYGGGGCD